jgi:hypothetical protein
VLNNAPDSNFLADTEHIIESNAKFVWVIIGARKGIEGITETS